MTDARLLSANDRADIMRSIRKEYHTPLGVQDLQRVLRAYDALTAENATLRGLLGELRAYVGKLEVQYVPMMSSHSYMPGLPATDDEIKSLAARLAAALGEEGE